MGNERGQAGEIETAMNYTLHNGLLVDESKTPPQCCGYISKFTGQHGAFAPDGKVMLQNGVLRDLEQGDVDEHNKRLFGLVHLTRPCGRDRSATSGNQPGNKRAEPARKSRHKTK